MRHKRVNRCTVCKKGVESSIPATEKSSDAIIENDMIYICTELSTALKKEYIDILEKTYTEDVTLNIRKTKEEPDKFVKISNKTLLHIIVWYYIRIFNIKIEKEKRKREGKNS